MGSDYSQRMSAMALINLPYIQRFKDRHGRVRHYARRPGCKRVALPGAVGSAEFMSAYQDAISPKDSAGRAPQAGSISALIAAYYQSSAWEARGEDTKRTYRNLLDRFRAKYGEGRATDLKPAQVALIMDGYAKTPGTASNMLKALRGAFDFAVERRLMRANPAKLVKLPRRKTAGFRAWTEDDIAKFEERWPEGSRARLALALLLYTGQRRSDVVTLGQRHVWNGSLRFRQKKAGIDAPLMTIPIHPTLKAALDKLDPNAPAFLMTAYGQPMSAAGFTGWFVECAVDAGLPKKSSPHGLRKAAARRLAEAGCSALEIMAITGHTSLKEVERYCQTVRQEQTAINAMGRVVNIDCQTVVSNPPETPTP